VRNVFRSALFQKFSLEIWIKCNFRRRGKFLESYRCFPEQSYLFFCMVDTITVISDIITGKNDLSGNVCPCMMCMRHRTV